MTCAVNYTGLKRAAGSIYGYAKTGAQIHQPAGLATGFGSFAFHPDFAKNGLLYTTHTEAPGSAPADFVYADSIKVTLQWVLTEWKVNDPNAAVFQEQAVNYLG